MKKFLFIIGLILAISSTNIVLGQESIEWNGLNSQSREIDSVSPTPAVRRFWSDTYKGHFYTADTPEANYITANYPTNVWSPEGTVFYAIYPDTTPGPNGCGFLELFSLIPVGACKPVYRFWSDTYKHHFFTISETEKNSVMINMPEWQYEGVSYAALTTNIGVDPLFSTTPLYRFWSNSYRAHFYTTSLTEKNNVINNMPEWQYEGIAYHVTTEDIFVP